ncbi:MAG: helix-turn-helix domain-containing transcriptional regulator [Gulosibacter sp.]|uniref:helix-turn-helix domain-containing transcriptional regulator n=1 Tax=Gulosibacter sp. TaxID=2817531 RepID=UPI003F8DF8A1
MSDSTEKFSPYDAADYLGNFEDTAAYLEAALADGDDPALVAQALDTIARTAA